MGLKNRISPFINYRESDGMSRAHDQRTNVNYLLSFLALTCVLILPVGLMYFRGVETLV